MYSTALADRAFNVLFCEIFRNDWLRFRLGFFEMFTEGRGLGLAQQLKKTLIGSATSSKGSDCCNSL